MEKRNYQEFELLRHIDLFRHIEQHNCYPVEFKVGEGLAGLWIPDGINMPEDRIKDEIRKYVRDLQRVRRNFRDKWDGTFAHVDRDEKIKQLKEFIKKWDMFNPELN